MSFSGVSRCFRWLATIRLSRLIALLLLLIIILPLLTHFYLAKFLSHDSEKNNDNTHQKLGLSLKSATLDDLKATSMINDVDMRIKEMMRIRGSVS